MKTTKRSSAYFLFLTFCLLLALPGQGQPPALINYQGRLVDGTNLVNGTVALELSLYDAASGGTLLYTDSNPAVTVIDGLYDTQIGANTTFGNLTSALESPQVWLQVVVNGTPLSPRERLVSVPYAMQAGSVGAASVGFNQLAQPYQADRINFQDLGISGPDFQQAVPHHVVTEIDFNQPFASIPSLTVIPQMNNPILLSDTHVQLLDTSLSNATIRLSLPRAHQHIGTGLVSLGGAIVDGRPAKVSTVGTQLVYQIAVDAAGLDWQPPQIVLATPNFLSHASLAVIDGYPAAAAVAQSGSAAGVYYVRATDAAGAAWAAPVQVSTVPAAHVHMIEINGRPGLVFEQREFDFSFDEYSNSVWYVVANDTIGTTWTAPRQLEFKTTIISHGLTEYTPRLLMADSLPAVVYMRGFPEFSSYEFRFRRANNIHGTSAWAADTSIYFMSDTISPDFWFGVSFDAMEVAGHPAVVMTQRDPTPRIRFMRANDAQGSSWPFADTVMNENMPPGAGRLSLSIIDGRPAVAALSGPQSDRLMYLRAQNTTGTSWFPALAQNLAHPNIDLGVRRLSLVEADGEPAILYWNHFLRSTQLPAGSLNWMAVQP